MVQERMAYTSDKRPLIGIVPLHDTAKGELSLVEGYVQGILHAGGAPLLLPITSDTALIAKLLPRFDGFLLVGGHDVDPSLYTNEAPSSKISPLTPVRDEEELAIVRYATEHDVPLLGICRGMQMINVALGGSLHQDLDEARQRNIIPGKDNVSPYVDHMQKGNFETPFHTIELVPGSCLACLYGHPGTITEEGSGGGTDSKALSVVSENHRMTLKVNSMHHQGIETLAPSLSVSACAPDTVIEGIEDPRKRFLIGVQWHPEYLIESEAGNEESSVSKGTIDRLAKALVAAAMPAA